jgi:hypothetical protein
MKLLAQLVVIVSLALSTLMVTTTHAIGPDEAVRASRMGAKLARELCGSKLMKITCYHAVLQTAVLQAHLNRGYGLKPGKAWDKWETALHKLKGFEMQMELCKKK